MKWGCDEIRSEWESLFAGIDEDNLPPLSSQWLGLRLDYVASLEMLSALRRPLSDSIEHIELWSYLVIKKNACFEDF